MESFWQVLLWFFERELSQRTEYRSGHPLTPLMEWFSSLWFFFFSVCRLFQFYHWITENHAQKSQYPLCSLFAPVSNQNVIAFFCGPKSYFRILNAINCCHHCMRAQCMRGALPLVTTCAIFFMQISLCVCFFPLALDFV